MLPALLLNARALAVIAGLFVEMHYFKSTSQALLNFMILTWHLSPIYLQWEVLPALLLNARALALIDELFVEIHYGDPAMAGCGWDQFYPRRIGDALALVRALRAAGLRTHLWP